MSLTIPSLTLSNIPFEESPTQSSGQANRSVATLDPLTLSSDSLSGFSGTSLTSQSFTVPVFGSITQQLSSIPPPGSLDGSLMSLSNTQQSVASDSTAPSDRIAFSSTPASTLDVTASPALDTSQIQQNYERQKTRAEEAEGESRELRATMNASREQVRDAARLLDGVLGTGNLNNEVYEQLSRAAGILRSATKSLR